jgi:hypothetical protein
VRTAFVRTIFIYASTSQGVHGFCAYHFNLGAFKFGTHPTFSAFMRTISI